MNWSDIATSVGKIAPVLGGLLTGPLGTAVAIGGVIASALGTENTPDAVSAALAVNPEAAVKLREIEANERVQLRQLALQQASAEIKGVTDTTLSVNQTMQAEGASEHWPTYGWRPAIGFAVAIAVAMSVLTVFLAYGAAIVYGRSDALQHLPGILGATAGIIVTVSPILGIASWFRGRMQADPGVSTNNKG